MWEDPIVADVHRIREKFAAEHNFDIAAFFADLRKRQAALGDRLVPPRKRDRPAAEPRQCRDAGSTGFASSDAPPAV